MSVVKPDTFVVRLRGTVRLSQGTGSQGEAGFHTETPGLVPVQVVLYIEPATEE
jgi:hypothetical protein